MNRIAQRSKFALILAAVLLIGLFFFVGEYLFQADDWIVFPGSPHVYSGANLNCGMVTDRSGTLLMDATDGRIYADDTALRRSVLHILGDRDGFISAPALHQYSSEMVGFDRFNGVYSLGGTGGKAVLTLSAAAQKAAQQALAGRKGTIGVYNYKTGEILCMVSSPNYDPDQVPDFQNDFSQEYEGVYLNRFTQATYVPGSIFKLVTTAAALETLPDAEEMTFTCTGSYQIGGDTVICDGVHGTLNLEGALAHSCNSAFAQLAMKLGESTLEKYAKKLQITEPVTFDGITTARGRFEVDRNTADVNVAWSAIGQYTDAVNPCRFMIYMGAIANGGIAAEPYLVASVQSGRTSRYKAKTSMTDRYLSAAAANALTDMMENNVQTIYGAGNFPGLTVCAKSGTAEVGGGRQPNATFAGFVRDAEYPLAFVVVVENGGGGSATCVPILSSVLQACVAELDSDANS